jgi:hypothetical protein
MKPIWILVVVLASVAAGGTGGFLATTLAEPASAPKVETVATTGVDHTEDLKLQADSIQALNKRMDTEMAAMRKDLRAAETEAASLKAQLAKQATRVENLSKPASGAQPESSDPAETVEPTAFEAQVQEAVEKLEEKRRAEQREEWQKRMTERTEERRKEVLTKLVDTLKLTTDQQAKVDVTLTEYTEKRRDLWRRGNEARENNQEFDWRAESATIETTYKEQIRSNLLGGQLQQFNELVGEGQIEDIAGGRRGWGGQGGGNRNRGN